MKYQTSFSSPFFSTQKPLARWKSEKIQKTEISICRLVERGTKKPGPIGVQAPVPAPSVQPAWNIQLLAPPLGRTDHVPFSFASTLRPLSPRLKATLSLFSFPSSFLSIPSSILNFIIYRVNISFPTRIVIGSVKMIFSSLRQKHGKVWKGRESRSSYLYTYKYI